MAETLSQAEIDALLKAMSEGEVDTDTMQQGNEKKIKGYFCVNYFKSDLPNNNN